MKEIDDMDDDERKSSSDWSLAGAYILLVLTVLLVPIAPFIFIQKFLWGGHPNSLCSFCSNIP